MYKFLSIMSIGVALFAGPAWSAQAPDPISKGSSIQQLPLVSNSLDPISKRMQGVSNERIKIAQQRHARKRRVRRYRRRNRNIAIGIGAAIITGIIAAEAARGGTWFESERYNRKRYYRNCERWIRRCDNGVRKACRKYDHYC